MQLINVSLEFLGAPFGDLTVNVLTETLQNDGLQPVVADKWLGIEGLTFSGVDYSPIETSTSENEDEIASADDGGGETSSDSGDETSTSSASTDAAGPTITHFEIINTEVTVGDDITVRFGAEDASGLGGLSVKFNHVDGGTGNDFGLLLVRILKLVMVFMKQLYPLN